MFCIRADGLVDSLDFAFIANGFLDSSKECCCGGAGAAFGVGRDTISVRDLRAAGFADLAVADLDHDGFVSTSDMNLWQEGVRPVKIGTGHGTKGGVRK